VGLHESAEFPTSVKEVVAMFVTHTLIGWTLAKRVALTRRDRALATLAGVIPDVDGLGLVAELPTRHGPT
jgi:hypothetical protein